MQLPAQQVAVLEIASADEATSVDALAAATELPPETVTGAVFELEDEGLVAVSERVDETIALTDEGREYADETLPEIALYEAALEAGADDEPVSMGQVIGASGLEGGAVDIALSNYARKGYGVIDSGEITADPDADPAADTEANALAELADVDDAPVDSVDIDSDTLDQLERRGLLERRESTVGEVTPELLTSGEWEDVEFAEYNVEADAERFEGGKVHILRQTAERVKDVLVGMGFQEMEGPHVDADFWINDCLFMPQDHPARTHWDRFALEQPTHIDDLPDDLVDRVERAHREGVGPDGEGYHSPWDEDFARALALRGHTTSLSTRYLSGEEIGDLEPPQRYFRDRKSV